MKTQAYIDALVAKDRQAWIEEHAAMKADIKRLESIYAEHLNTDRSPKDTIKVFIGAVGIERASVIVATLINRHNWDGRISKRNTLWAAAIDASFDEDTSTSHFYCTHRIHMSHLDQLADEMRKGASHE